jgi:hypothetical protein
MGNPAPELVGDQRWDLVLRIAESQRFAKAARLRDFLLYVCHAAIDRHTEEISEQKVGERVFHRAHDYNPNDDNIVRSQARLLRQKLEGYFADEGVHEPLIVRIPKGGYVPEFVERPMGPVGLPRIAPAGHPILVPVLVACVAALSIAVAVLGWSMAHMQSVGASTSVAPSVAALWSQLLSDKVTTTIVVPDHTFAMLQEASGQREDLEAYMHRSVHDSTLLTILPRFPMRRYTTFDGVSTAIRVLQLAEKFPSKVVVRFARDIALRDLSGGNVVLIGRPATNLWTELFESKLNFRIESKLADHQVVCKNLSPRPDEQSEYVPKTDGNRYEACSSIAFLPNLNGGNVLIIGGAASSSQEGAADFATSEAFLSQLAKKIGHTARFPYFDALIRTTSIDGISQQPSMLAYRVLDGAR